MSTEDRFGSAPARAGLVVVLTGVLVFASGGAPVWSPRGIAGLDRPSIVAALAVLFSLFLLIATGWAFVVHRRRRSAPGSPPSPGAELSLRTTFVRLLPIALTAWVAIGLYGIAEGHLGRPPDVREVATRPEPTRLGQALRFIGGWDTPVVDAQGRPLPEGEAGDPIPNPPLPMIVGLLVVSVGVAGWAWRRSGRSEAVDRDPDLEEAPEPLDAVATHQAVVGTIAAMLRDPDPNTAVIGAYAHLLEGLSEVGAPRRDHEGPSEHLRRVLGTLRVRQAPLRRLVTLFESARFSSRTLTTEHRARALDALEAVADELLVGVAPAASRAPPDAVGGS